AHGCVLAAGAPLLSTPRCAGRSRAYASASAGEIGRESAPHAVSGWQVAAGWLARRRAAAERGTAAEPGLCDLHLRLDRPAQGNDAQPSEPVQSALVAS